MHRLFSLVLGLAAIFACNATELPTTAQEGGIALAGGAGSVNGSGHFDRQDTGTYRNVTVHADSRGGVTGGITFINHFETGVTVSKADIYCVLFIGTNKAILGGTITRDDIDPTRVGLDTLVTVEDNGEGRRATGPDRISLGGILDTGDAQQFCDGTPINQFLFDVENGNLQVRP
jgi:hypothetical protein